MEDVLKAGYPPSLVQKFLVDGNQRRQRKMGSEERLWENSDEGKLFHKLVFLKSFLYKSDEDLTTAREMARTRVYNLRYLMPERCWGPFLPDDDNAREAILRTRFPNFEEEISHQIMNVDDGLGQIGQIIHITTNADEGFYPFLSTDASDVRRADTEEDDDHQNDEEDEEDERVEFFGHPHNPAFITPKPHQVVPDYAFLSAARLLVEMNLKEVLALDTEESDDSSSVDASVSRLVDAFACLDLMRMGGAPSFWTTSWPIHPEDLENSELSLNTPTDHVNSKGKAKETDEFQGWDWAGVAGEWK